jgi:DNA-binding CsgD family transcriptional regulator
MLILPDFRRFELASRESDIPEPAVHRELAAGNIELSRLWHLLFVGELKIVGTSSVADRAFAELASRSSERPGSSPRPCDRLLFERVLEGECPKALAAEVGVSPSSLSTRCARILTWIGCEGSVSRTSPLVSMAVLAARGVPLGRTRVDALSRDGQARWLVSVTNPAESLRDMLSPCEYEVARYSIDGTRQVEIALLRGTSQRTVANQLASAFRKLNVSGRAALRALAIRLQATRRLKFSDPGETDVARQVSVTEYCMT